MSNYENMSRFEINKLVSKNTDFGEIVVSINDSNETVYLCEKDGIFSMIPISDFDPCSNPSDAWPIILPTGMSIELAHPDLGGIGTCTIYNPMGTDWQCDFDNNDDALWAAMVCFLKMKDDQDDI
jgi:hypothetical protein